MNGKNVTTGACIYAGNMNTMVRFYRDTLGLHAEWDGGDFAEFETASGKLALFMYSRDYCSRANLKTSPPEAQRSSK